jgi:hypothetical protein
LWLHYFFLIVFPVIPPIKSYSKLTSTMEPTPAPVPVTAPAPVLVPAPALVTAPDVHVLDQAGSEWAAFLSAWFPDVPPEVLKVCAQGTPVSVLLDKQHMVVQLCTHLVVLEPLPGNVGKKIQMLESLSTMLGCVEGSTYDRIVGTSGLAPADSSGAALMRVICAQIIASVQNNQQPAIPPGPADPQWTFNAICGIEGCGALPCATLHWMLVRCIQMVGVTANAKWCVTTVILLCNKLYPTSWPNWDGAALVPQEFVTRDVVDAFVATHQALVADITAGCKRKKTEPTFPAADFPPAVRAAVAELVACGYLDTGAPAVAMSKDQRVFSYRGVPEVMGAFMGYCERFDAFDSSWAKKTRFYNAKVAEWPDFRRMAFLMALSNVRKFSVTMPDDASLMDMVARDTVLLVQYMEFEPWTDCAEQVRALCPPKRKRAKTTPVAPEEDN